MLAMGIIGILIGAVVAFYIINREVDRDDK